MSSASESQAATANIFAMSVEEENIAWAAMLWKMARRGEDPETAWGPPAGMLLLFKSVCLDLRYLEQMLREVVEPKGRLNNARMLAPLVNREFKPENFR